MICTKWSSTLLDGKKALLLDMNSTFMFGEDRFGEAEDFSVHYFSIGGALPKHQVNELIRAAYEYLDERYPNEIYRHCFPSVESALREVTDVCLDESEIEKVVDTFAFHELGHITSEYVAALHKLKRKFILAAVIDIWSSKFAWLDTFERTGIAGLFSAMSFSSDHGMVKPSPKPFELVLDQLEISKTEAVVIGDSPRRDLGGARNAGIDCILVGGAVHPHALGSVKSLLELCETLSK